MKQAILESARALGGFAAARALTAGKLRILCYHGLWTLDARPFGNRLFIPIAIVLLVAVAGTLTYLYIPASGSSSLAQPRS